MRISSLVKLATFYASLSFNVVQAGDPCVNSRLDAIKNVIFRIRPSLNSMDSGSVSAWGGGGGPQRTIPGDSAFPFAGRQYGGGDRSTIYGTRSYGSGYPYGVNSSSNDISGRPFPYGTWPISFGNYRGGQEFLDASIDLLRPGGPMAVVKVSSTDTQKWPGISSTEVYDMLGDTESLLFMMADLVDWCHATPQWPAAFDPTASSAVRPENIIQYYRSSSFAMAYSAYNNTFATANQSTSQSLTDSTPLPSIVASSSFWSCINDTIGVALPILDAPPSPDLPGWVYALIIAAPFIIAAIPIYIDHRVKKRKLAEQQNGVDEQNQMLIFEGQPQQAGSQEVLD
jgi:hypothetical protein